MTVIILFCFALKQDVAEVEKRYKKTLDKHSKIYRADMRKKIKKIKNIRLKRILETFDKSRNQGT
jgi:hypothetical protein